MNSYFRLLSLASSASRRRKRRAARPSDDAQQSSLDRGLEDVVRPRKRKRVSESEATVDAEIDIRSLSVDSPPTPTAKALLELINDIGRGLEILPHLQREAMEKEVDDFSKWKYSFAPSDKTDSLPGQIPSIAEIRSVCKHAKRCFDSGHEQAAWNSEVHFRLLEAILRKSEVDDVPLDFTTCISARPHPRYLPRAAMSGKLADFCIYSNPKEVEAQRALCQVTPTKTSNHTSFKPLQLTPILFSITAGTGDDMEATQHQMGHWLEAQWSFLRDALEKSLQTRDWLPDMTEDQKLEQLQDHDEEIEEALKELSYLPGVIIHGHHWSLVLSTPKGHRTVLWAERQFGSTQSILETYQIVAGLRELLSWAQEKYLPWIRRKILLGFYNAGKGHYDTVPGLFSD